MSNYTTITSQLIYVILFDIAAVTKLVEYLIRNQKVRSSILRSGIVESRSYEIYCFKLNCVSNMCRIIKNENTTF